MASSIGDEEERRTAGTSARRPTEIPKRGWFQILKRSLTGLSKENGSYVSAGVAFYVFLAIPAILTVLISVYGLVANPTQVQQEVASLRGVVPNEALTIVSGQLKRITSHTGGTLTFALVASILFALWSGSNSVKALIFSMNIAYNEAEKRSFWRYNAIALGLTLGGIVFAAVTIGLVVAVSAGIGAIHLPWFVATVITVLRWPILAAIVLFALAVLYRYCPSRREPKWRWVSPGALVATGIWLAVSALFSWYVSSFGSYDKTYGSLGAIVVLLMWLYISAYAVLIGAKVNAESERQTEHDSTVGPEKPIGTRGAYAADRKPPKAA